MTRARTAICCMGIAVLLLGGTAFAGSVEINPSLKGADLATAKKVKASLDNSLKQCASCQVKIDLKDGVVSLTGQVPPEHAQALKGVSGVPGVKSVKAGGVKTGATFITGDGVTTTKSRGTKETPSMPGSSKTAEAVSTHVAKQGSERKSIEKMPGSPSR